ncbi:MAG: SusC/RagA family TonB-linked outer membrane protein [Bacteroidales bacterium]
MRVKLFAAMLFLVIQFPVTTLFAQSSLVKGTVLSKEDSQSIPGVNVVVKGSTHGVSTDINGKYSIQADKKDILVFSFIGFRPQEILVGDQKDIDVVLIPVSTNLDEVVVVGYGSKKKSDLIGSVSSVKNSDMIAIPSSDIQGMLKGQVAGLTVSVANAAPGGGSNVLLRGINSLRGGTSPLYVVDGLPIDNINEINVNDIETVSVLKDASAQAIYGARASNGVILITTRRGVNSKGKINISYDGYLTFQNVSKQMKLFTAPEYIQLRREAFRGDDADSANGWIGKYKPDSIIFNPTEQQNIKDGTYVDWLDQAFKKNALLTKHDIAISGGNDRTRYSASVGIFYQDGIRLSSDYKRYNGKLVLDQEVTKWLTVGASAYYSHYLQNLETQPLTGFITFSPIARLYDANGNLNEYPLDDNKSVNPLWWDQTQDSTYVGDRGIYTAYLDIAPVPIPGLKYRLNGSFDNSYRQASGFHSLDDPSKYYGKGYINIQYRKIWNYNIENILTYEAKAFKTHRYDLTLMQSVYQRDESSTSTIATKLANDFFGINSLGSATETAVGRTEQKRSMVSFMGRVNYIINDKYLFNFTIRADGSSVFGSNNKWGYFPSGAFSWNMQNEPFMKGVKWISESKLRISAGQIGNEGISPYGSLSLAADAFYVSNGVPIIGYLPGTTLPNPNLKWESTTTYNIGYDFSVLKSRLNGSIEVYKKITTNLLVLRQIPSGLGYSTIPDNLGEIMNTGIEASLNGFVVSNHNLSWMVGAKFALNKNKLTKGVLQDPATGEYVDDIVNKWFIGQPANVYYDYKFDGIWQIGDDIAHSAQPKAHPGDIRVADVSGPNGVPDGIITADDRVVIPRDPDFVMSFNTTLKYKGLEFSADIYYVQGTTRRNVFMSDYNSGGTMQGGLNGIYRNYWLPETGGNVDFRPHYESGNVTPYISSLDYQDASYVRLTNVTIAYNLPAKWIKSMKMTKFKVYLRGDRLFTFTKYESFGPETDPDAYPESRDVTVGVNVSF